MRHIVPLTRYQRHALVEGPKVFANSIPKSGTHLLRHVLSLLPGVVAKWTFHYSEDICDCRKQLSRGKHGQVISAHMYWNRGLSGFLAKFGYKPLLMIRDLRDVCVSSAHYCATNKQHRLYGYFNSLDSWSEQLSAVIAGIDGNKLPDGVKSKSIAEHVEGYMPWLYDPRCLTIRFEDLVGPRGGGDAARQHTAINAIAAHLALNLVDKQIDDIASQSFISTTKTFRKGKIGSWRQEFTDENIELFKQVAGRRLIDMGYEQGNDW